MFRHRSATPAGVAGNGEVRSLGNNVTSIYLSLGSDRFRIFSALFVFLWGQTDLEFSPLSLSLFGVPLSLGSDRFRIFSAHALFALSLGSRSLWSLWGQTDLEFSDRHGFWVSSGSDRFRIFSAHALFALSLGSRSLWVSLWAQTDLEFSPLRPRARSSARRSRLAFDSLWSRAANRADRLGTLSGRERPRCQ